MTEERALDGGAVTEGIVRIGDTVRRPAHQRTRSMRDVLVHLERVGFDAAPRWLGRDIRTWIEGDTVSDRGQMHPYIGDPPTRITFSDDQIAAAFRLLRRYHETFGADVICHGDFGPWNLVWRDGLPVAMIDFDQVHEADASEDVAYALRMFVSYGFALAAPVELVRRTEVALSAYGRRYDVPSILELEYGRAEQR